MDIGHYHPTESVADKLTAVGPFVNHILLHVTRGVRWDSDHVVIRSDELDAVMSEVKRAGYFGKVGIGLDFFDASINRIAAWVIGMRAAGRSLLNALLEPTHLIKAAEADGDYTSRLALMEEFKTSRKRRLGYALLPAGRPGRDGVDCEHEAVRGRDPLKKGNKSAQGARK